MLSRSLAKPVSPSLIASIDTLTHSTTWGKIHVGMALGQSTGWSFKVNVVMAIPLDKVVN